MDILKHNGNILRYNGAPLYWEAGESPSYPTDGLISRWLLASGLVDTVSSYTFTRAYGASDAYTDGALVFDGTKGYTLDSTTVAGITNGVGNYSVSIWVKATVSSAAGQPIVTIDTSNTTWASMGVTPTNLGGGVGWYGVRSLNSSGDWPWWNKTIDGNWHHYVTTFQSGQFYAYLDNSKLTQSGAWGAGQSTTKNLGTGQRYVLLGWGYDNGTQKFIGSAKYLYIYNKVLSSAEISTLYNGGVPI